MGLPKKINVPTRAREIKRAMRNWLFSGGDCPHGGMPVSKSAGFNRKTILRKAAAAVAALTAADVFCAMAGMRRRVIEEANPLFAG